MVYRSIHRPATARAILGWRGRALPCLALLILLPMLPVAAAAAEDSWQIAHQQAVQNARAGDTAGALMRLRDLHERFPQRVEILHDLAVVSAWHGDDEAVLALLRDAPSATLPDYVLTAYARSARNARQWQLAQELYGALAQRPEQKVTGVVGQALLAADTGEFERGEQMLARLDPRPAPATTEFAQLQLACGYLRERAADYTGALACYNQGIRFHPDDGELRKRRALVAAALGAAVAAGREIERSGQTFSAAELQRIELDQAALRLRWAAVVDESRELAAGTAVAQQYDELAKIDGSQPAALMYDRFVALVGAYRMPEAELQLAEILQAHGPAESLPAYVQASAGRLCLYQDRPEQAVEYYRGALLAAGDSADADARFAWQMGLFQALADAQRYEELAAHVDALERQELPWLRPGRDIWKANERFAQSAEAAAMHRAYRDEHEAALARLDEMLSVAPANGSVRLSRAAVKRWRGWYAESAADVETVAASGGYPLRANVDKGHLALDRQSYAQVVPALQAARALHPKDKAVLDLSERWRIHNRPQLLVYANAGHSNGGAEGNRDYELESFLYSSPIATRYRLFAHAHTRYADFDEGIGRDTRLGAGVELRNPGLTVRAELNQGIEQLEKTGAAVSAEWWLSDRWYANGGAAVHSTATPLRALRAGISGDELHGALGYRWHESRRAELGVGGMRLDDDNQRRWLSGSFTQRLFSAPRHKIDGVLGAYLSRNSEADAIYFNPRRDREVTAGLLHEWRLLHSRERQLVQRLGVTAGQYFQEDYGSDGLWRLQWEHDWQLSRTLQLSYGASYGRRPYDGELERQINYFLTLGARL